MAVQKKGAPPSAAGRAAPPSRAAAPSTTGASTSNAGQRASYNPEDFVQGGLIDDIDVTFDSVRFTEWDYKGAIDTPVLALLVTMTYDDNGSAKTEEQYYSAGDLKRFQPSEDGCHAISVGGGKGLASGTNVAELLKSLKDAGFPMEKLAEDAGMSNLDGMFCHINRIPQQERKGIKRDTEERFAKTVAVVTKIHRMPWEKVGQKTAARPTPINKASVASAKGPASAAPAASPSEEASDVELMDVDDMVLEAAQVLHEVLKVKKSVKKTGLSPASFKILAGNPNRGAILELFTKEGFLNLGASLGEYDIAWDYDDVTVSLPS